MPREWFIALLRIVDDLLYFVRPRYYAYGQGIDDHHIWGIDALVL